MIQGETVPAGALQKGRAAKLMLLRRVGGAVGDELQAQLQPLLLVHEVLQAALARSGEVGTLREPAGLIKPAVQRALAAGAAATEWLLPRPGAHTPSTELAAECAALLRPEFTLCGLGVELIVNGEPLPIERDAGRTMVCAVLAHAGDHAPGPGRILVELAHRDAVCEVRVSHRRANEEFASGHLAPQQPAMEWDDLLALAQLEGATLRREGGETLVLELAVASGA
ncbi:MAG TPA: hypothetical protein VFM98_25295 [Ramlibacter sp.]|uniref:hypothetical protein n=1 Tax=Ramlibacter sp. TaxID=1917967 RepID=UPI002D7FCA41|nr:hypothetical protein [Ramlibacter sp.]HET8748934.1 hypothetical protein [Ramlibacter sp.]